RDDPPDARQKRRHRHPRAARAGARRGLSHRQDRRGDRGAGRLGRRDAARDRLHRAVRRRRRRARDGGARERAKRAMSDALDLLWLPFLVPVCLIGIHTYFGIEVLRRKVIFVDLALAQIAALGTTVAFMLGHAMQGTAAYAYSLAFTLAAALLLAFVPQWSRRLPQEALIGVIYVVAAAAAILLIDRAPQGAEHLKQILTGNILTAGADALVTIVPLYAAIGILHAVLRRRIAAGQGACAWEFVFYASFGVVVTSSVALAGVLLVFSFLIIPACIGVLHAEALPRQLATGWIAGALAGAAGLAASYLLDLPTGATMVCAFGAALALAGLAVPFRRGGARVALGRVGLTARALAGAVLVASGALLMVAPRADQP